MSPEFTFEFHEVADGLYVGPCPNSPERIRQMKLQGLTGVVSVQTDDDLHSMGMNYPLLWKFLMGQGFSCHRHPIEDFNQRALTAQLDHAVALVDDLRRAGRPTYLHCTAGVNRSPTVAIAYLIQHQNMSLDDAWEQVTTRRPSVPNRLALERWLAIKAKS